MTRIPASVGMLTFNSGATLRRALLSVREFDDILLCDGGSTDDTLAIAAEFGARVVPQDRRFLSKDGRLQDFGGARNQTLKAAARPWFFFLDSDEYASPALVREIRAAVAGEPAAYWVPRRYVYEGRVIERAVTYPNRQMRFFHQSVAREFIKEVHERIELLPDSPVKELSEPLLVPMEDSMVQMKEKWHRYIMVESLRAPRISLRQWMRGAGRETSIGILYALRFLRNLLLPGSRLPARLELLRLWYQWAVITTSLRRVRHW